MDTRQLAETALERLRSFEEAADAISDIFEEKDNHIHRKLDATKSFVDRLLTAVTDELNFSRIRFVKPLSVSEIEMNRSRDRLKLMKCFATQVEANDDPKAQGKQPYMKKASLLVNASICKQLVLLLSQKLPPVTTPGRIRASFHTSITISEDIKNSALIWVRSSFYPITRDLASIKQPVKTFGKKARGPGFFDRPRAMCIHPMSGDVYVCNKFKDRIDVFSKELEHMIYFNPLPNGRTNIEYPDGIAVASDGTCLILYDGKTAVLADPEHKRVFIKATSEQYSTFLEETHRIASVAVDADDNFYLADIHTQRVYVVDISGNVERSFRFPNHVIGKSVTIHSISFNERRELMLLQKYPTVLHFLSPLGNVIRSVSLGLSGDMVLSRSSYGGFLICNYSEGIVEFYDHTGIKIREMNLDYYRAAVFGIDGSLYMLNSSEGSVSIW